jgi:hypothetical protein
MKRNYLTALLLITAACSFSQNPLLQKDEYPALPVVV